MEMLKKNHPRKLNPVIFFEAYTNMQPISKKRVDDEVLSIKLFLSSHAGVCVILNETWVFYIQDYYFTVVLTESETNVFFYLYSELVEGCR